MTLNVIPTHSGTCNRLARTGLLDDPRIERLFGQRRDGELPIGVGVIAISLFLRQRHL